MTNERAIELLNRISDSQFDGPHGDERREALEMAVRAMSGDGDTISRKQAIDAVVSAMIDGADAELVEGIMEMLPSAQQQRILYANMSDAEFEKWLYEHGICNPNIHESIPCDVVPLLIDNAISELPSAQPERKTGRWKLLYDNIWICTNCEQTEQFGVNIESTSDYCPSCGADMRGKIE